jgi:hypothetical protein
MSTDLKKRVVHVSSGKPENLSKAQISFLNALYEKLKSAGLEVSRDSPPSDGVARRYDKICGIDGLVVVAFSQWSAHRLNRKQDQECILTSEFAHIVNTMAVAAEKPLLVIMEKDVGSRGTLREGYVPRPSKPPRSLREDWLQTSDFEADFSKWLQDVNNHKHVFLGYSGEAGPVASSISVYLTGLGVDILDWHQFKTGGYILQRVEEAAKSTACGIFLFTASDELTRKTGPRKVPRDNVIFELGFFAGKKGKERTLVIVEEGTDVPTDLGGYIHVPLPKSRDTKGIETRLAKFINDNLQTR